MGRRGGIVALATPCTAAIVSFACGAFDASPEDASPGANDATSEIVPTDSIADSGVDATVDSAADSAAGSCRSNAKEVVDRTPLVPDGGGFSCNVQGGLTKGDGTYAGLDMRPGATGTLGSEPVSSCIAAKFDPTPAPAVIVHLARAYDACSYNCNFLACADTPNAVVFGGPTEADLIVLDRLSVVSDAGVVETRLPVPSGRVIGVVVVCRDDVIARSDVLVDAVEVECPSP